MTLSLSMALPGARPAASGSPPAATPNAQLVLNKPSKTGFTYLIRML